VKVHSGAFKGRILRAPDGQDTRPMLGRVRESMYSTLGGIEEDQPVLDLFSGSGSTGIEALSRGASLVRFVERERPALGVLRSNLALVGAEDRSEVIGGDALDARHWRGPAPLPPGAESKPWAAVILMDPPYPMLRGSERDKVLAAALTLAKDVLLPGGALVLHGHPRDLGRDALSTSDFQMDHRVMGRTALLYLWK
jgi:16S rRNA (guanine966-N2)-methyltransferase